VKHMLMMRVSGVTSGAGLTGLLDPVEVGLACGSDTAHLVCYRDLSWSRSPLHNASPELTLSCVAEFIWLRTAHILSRPRGIRIDGCRA